ncbi:peptidoglycan editing factor PgeF [Edaphobacter sp. HDX4]|uniref:peptidoglycan editing factor PgeF n=1 Tax=Edaphobacter sp. HDX4 TaxID=2794064 RepID=UPI002FE5940D
MTELPLLQVPEWLKFSWLRHGFSTRHGGVSKVYGEDALNLGWTAEDDPSAVRENRRLLVNAAAGEASSSNGMKLVTVRQVHSSRIHVIQAQDAHAGRLETPEGKAVLEGDGLITNEHDVLLAAGTADCVPVLLLDPHLRVVGAFHAGWRGTAGRIVEQGVEKMQKDYGSNRHDLLAAIGPSIGSCCYTVGEDVREKFDDEFSYSSTLFHETSNTAQEIKFKIDLWKANNLQLLDAGLEKKNITVIGECTACTLEPSGQPRYFSHRAQAGRTGRMLNVIGIRNTKQQS